MLVNWSGKRGLLAASPAGGGKQRGMGARVKMGREVYGNGGKRGRETGELGKIYPTMHYISKRKRHGAGTNRDERQGSYRFLDAKFKTFSRLFPKQ